MSIETPTPGPPATCTLAAHDLRQVLLVRAFEEADEAEEILARGERWQATEDARASNSGEAPRSSVDAGRFLAQRASTLTAILSQRAPMTAPLQRAAALGSTGWLVIAAAAIFGLLSNALGPTQRVNIVANSLLGLLLWNLIVFALLAAQTIRSSLTRANERVTRSRSGRLAEFLLRLRARASSRGQPTPSTRAAASYLAQWHDDAAPLISASGRRLMHSGALAMVLGSLASMYLRGLVFQYRATWESTFVGADTMASLTGALLGPAAFLTGLEIPGVGAIRAMEAPASGDAAIWIHLLAVTTLVFVVVPRGLLAAHAAWVEGRLARALPLDLGSPYYRRLFAAHRNVPTHVHVFPYSHRTAERAGRALKTLLRETFGPRADITLHGTLEYGTEASQIDLSMVSPEEGELHCAVVFGLAQTPEIEVHGRFLVELMARIRGIGGVLVFIDGSAYRARAAEDPEAERRTAERTRAWDLVVRDAGLDPLQIELGADPTTELVERVAAAARADSSQEETMP